MRTVRGHFFRETESHLYVVAMLLAGRLQTGLQNVTSGEKLDRSLPIILVVRLKR